MSSPQPGAPAAEPLAGRCRTHDAVPVEIQLLEPSANLGLTELLVTPGLVDEHARELFLYAQCEVLALCLREFTGWPLWAAEQQLPDGRWNWAHVGVRTPAGRWLDIEGPRAVEDVTGWLASWGLPVRARVMDGAAWNVMLGRPPATPAAWWRTRVTTPAGIELAEVFARALLRVAER